MRVREENLTNASGNTQLSPSNSQSSKHAKPISSIMIACFWRASQPKLPAVFASADGASEEILTTLRTQFAQYDPLCYQKRRRKLFERSAHRSKTLRRVKGSARVYNIGRAKFNKNYNANAQTHTKRCFLARLQSRYTCAHSERRTREQRKFG